jgi:LDH2 family malate/lactate/ureidoglycolate dehydrogenase
LGMEQAGHVQPAAQACVVHRHNATAMLGDGWGWGQPSILLAPDVAIELARAHGGGAMLLTASCFLGPGATHSRGAQDGKHADPRTYAGRAALPCVKGLDVTHKQRP